MKKNRIYYVDFARGYAILTIVLYHLFQNLGLPSPWSQIISFGGAGVHLFFLISGFGLGFTKGVKPGQFYNKRLKKVYIPFFLVLTLSLLLNFIIPVFPNDNIWTYLSGVLIFPLFTGSGLESYGGHLWFISTIFQFYIIFPLLIWIRNKWGIERLLVLGIAVSVGFWFFIYATGNFTDRFWNSLFPQYLWEFVLGMYLTHVYKEKDWGFWKLPFYYYIGAIVLSGGLFVLITKYLGEGANLFNDVPILFIYVSISILVFQFLERFIPFLYRFFLHFGGISYSVYLIHQLVLQTYLWILGESNIAISLVLLLASLPLMYLAALGFEQFSQWVGKLMDPPKKDVRKRQIELTE